MSIPHANPPAYYWLFRRSLLFQLGGKSSGLWKRSMGLARTLFVEKLHATTVSPFNPCQFVGTEDRVLCAECVYPILVLYSSNPHTHTLSLSVCVCVCVCVQTRGITIAVLCGLQSIAYWGTLCRELGLQWSRACISSPSMDTLSVDSTEYAHWRSFQVNLTSELPVSASTLIAQGSLIVRLMQNNWLIL